MFAGMRPLILLSLLCAGCGADRDVTVRFEALVGDAPARCGGTYDGVGTTGTQLTVGDLRFYVHDVRFVTADGGEVPLALRTATSRSSTSRTSPTPTARWAPRR